MRNCLTPAAMLEKQGFRGTVLLDMEGTLLARKWDRVHGYRFSKRPFADEFLIMLSQMGYEIVLFSDSPVAVGNETADKLVRVSGRSAVQPCLPVLMMSCRVAALPAGVDLLQRRPRSGAHDLPQR